MSKDKKDEVVFFQSATMIGVEFVNIIGDYLVRQEDDPNFDPRTALYDLYDELVQLYEKAKHNE